jgi:hypothetical protein
MAPVKNILTTGPLQQGSTRIDYKLQPRIISLVIDAIASTIPTFFSQRSALLEAFIALSPYPLKLIIEWDVAGPAVVQRLIDVFYNGQMTMASKDMAGFHQKTIVELIAPYPVWRSDDLQTLTFNGVGAQVHTYVGSWEVQPWQVKITGSKVDPCVTVTHADGTSEKLDFDGLTIGGGHYVEIDCRYDYRTILYDGVTDYSGYLTDDSNFGTFCIKKTVDSVTHLVSGWNEINVTGSDTGVVVIKFYPNYIGV